MKSGHIGLLVLELAGNINLVATKASKLYTEQTIQAFWGNPRHFDLFGPEILVRSGAYWTLWKAGRPRIIFALVNF